MVAVFASSGNSDIDAIMGGGFRKGKITLIYGPGGAGKTTLAMLLFLEHAKRNKKVVYIDTEQGFSLNRLEQLSPKYKWYLDYLLMFKPKNLNDQLNLIKKLHKTNLLQAGAIIIDTISYHYRLNRASERVASDQNLSIQIENLADIADKNNIPVVIITQVYDDIDASKTMPIGKELLTSNSNCVISISKLNGNRRKLTFNKQINSITPKQIYFSIVNEGIKLV